MIRLSELTKETYKTGDVAKLLGLSNQAIIDRDNKGILNFERNERGRRYMTKVELIKVLDERGLLVREDDKRHDVVYARVSTAKQRERGDLDRQVVAIMDYLSGTEMSNLLVLKEVGSGLNDKRKELLKLIRLVNEHKVKRIFVHYKDRLTRFGFNYLAEMCKCNDTEIIVVSEEISDKTIQEELAEDIVSIIHSFSGKLYGMRKLKKDEIEDMLYE